MRFVKDTGVSVDTTVMTREEFKDNLTLGSVLMGVSIAFCVTYDEVNVYEEIERWSNEVRKYHAVLDLPYGNFVVGRTIRKCKVIL
ncbi:hypothetical protein IC006_0673 [Sulfuracidifex tepidarius]|uniref:Uncharacterized protein n=1 Tax=Sulfuracidifex tepidarius TaxID=1294262 RepID=A0A510E0Z3_9CREN|nr:hypothetical protein [Sulfuracidifex tepidarius]BBG23389.1 hypothetical protein IC006_0673 [Sulfuracidifex tepidarius]BBG26142.1 hypothetical protein IC007_0647 [Sulfuracidifex tepidarius]